MSVCEMPLQILAPMMLQQLLHHAIQSNSEYSI